MFMNFVSQVNMVNLNTLPMAKGLFTRFMDSSGRPGTRSLLDYGMVDGDHTHTVKSFVIDETARYDCGSDHALLEVDMEFGVRPKLNWSIQDVLKFNIPEKADFTEYHQNQDNFSSTIRLDHFTDLTVEQMLPHISDTLTKSAMKSFGLKVKKTNPKGNMLPKSIIRMIRSKNKVSRDYHQAVASSDLVKSEHLQDELQKLKDQVNDSIASIRLGRRQRLRNTLLKADPTRKKFWRFLKGQMKTAGNITALNNKEGKMVFEQKEIEETILCHFEEIFKATRHPVLLQQDQGDQNQICIDELDLLLSQHHPTFQPTQFEEEVCSPYTYLELDHLLKQLKSGKSSGLDTISNEMIKNSSHKFKNYLLIFLNKIMANGTIPPDLNIGKCILIFKVYK